MSKTHIATLFESATISKAKESKQIPSFRAGDTVSAKIKIIDGASERVSAFQGVCIMRSNKGINSYCVLRKMSGNIGVERIVPIYSPLVVGLDVIKRGKVRRAKLFYLRSLRGKKARIKELNQYTQKASASSN